MHLLQWKKAKKAFTLIELIIVIVVVGLLAGLAMPKFIGVSRDAKVATLLRDIDTLQKVIPVYYIDHNEYPVFPETLTIENERFKNFLLRNGESLNHLHRVDLEKTKPYHTKLKHGYGEDYFIYSKETGLVYYSKGIINSEGEFVYGHSPANEDNKNVYLDDTLLTTEKINKVGRTNPVLKGKVKADEEVTVTVNNKTVDVSYEEPEPSDSGATDGTKIFKSTLDLSTGKINEIIIESGDTSKKYSVEVLIEDSDENSEDNHSDSTPSPTPTPNPNVGPASFAFINTTQDKTYYNDIIENNNQELVTVGHTDSDAIITVYNPASESARDILFGGSSSEQFLAIKQTQDGGYIVCGASNSTDGDLSSITNEGIRDAILVKYDQAWNIEWVRSFGTSSIDIFRDVDILPNGNYIVTGFTMSPFQNYLIAYDENGTQLWTKTIDINGNNIHSLAIKCTDDNYIIVAGHLGNGITEDSTAYIIKYDQNGTYIWHNTISTFSRDEFYDVEAKDDYYIAVGTSNKGAIIAKYGENGNLIWKKIMGEGGKEDYHHSVVITGNGEYIVSGDSISCDGEFSVLKTYELNNYGYIAKLDENGSPVWINGYVGHKDTICHSVTRTSDNGYAITGYVYPTTYFDCRSKNEIFKLTQFKNSKENNMTGFIIKYTETGDME